MNRPHELDEEDRDSDAVEIAEQSVPRMVFRVRPRVERRFLVGSIMGLLAGAILAFGFSGTSTAGLAAVIAAGTLLGAITNALLSARAMPGICSDPECATPLSAELRACPGCGCAVMGDIAHPRERLDAEQFVLQRAATTEYPSSRRHSR